jgi:hypothetical protein
MSKIAGYMICYSDSVYNGPYILPLDDTMPRMIHPTFEGAETMMRKWLTTVGTFQPALYGSVYPFEDTTAAKEMESKGFALYGWVDDESEDERYGIYIVAIPWAA